VSANAYDVVLRTIIDQQSFENGICPLSAGPEEIAIMLRSLPPDEAHRMKRRFRKLWRQHKKKMIGRHGPGRKRNEIEKMYGTKGSRCTTTQAWRRRHGIKVDFMETYNDELTELYKIVHGHDLFKFL
jgi:hypothetical protein